MALADRIGTDNRWISLVESGSTNTSLDRLLDLADALGAPPAALMPGGPWPDDLGPRPPDRG